MRIYMYNTWFGDCFELEMEKSSLFVDFGIHKQCLCSPIPIYGTSYSASPVDKKIVHSDISSEIVSKSVLPNLLITHYHLDHYSGLQFMMYNGYISPAFNTVYLPDIWNFKNSRHIVALHFLEELFKRAKLTGAKSSITLLDFIKYLCGNVNKIELLRRGKKFEADQFVALWPDPSIVGAYANNLIPRTIIDSINGIFTISDKLIEIVQRMISVDSMAGISQSLKVEISDLIVEFEKYSLPDVILNTIDEIELNGFINGISIVFQNNMSNEENILFTGDINNKYMYNIANNYDSIISMHSEYKVIKIPHHGTKAYYFDFSKYNPQKLLFPNGKCHDDSYKISALYGISMKSMSSVTTYCSNSNWCEMNALGRFSTCPCVSNIVFPELRKIIN